MGRLTTGQRASILVALAFVGGAVAVLFQPVTVDEFRPRNPADIRASGGNFSQFNLECGSWVFRHHRHEGNLCHEAIRGQRIFGYAIAIAAVPVLLLGLVAFRRTRRSIAQASAVFIGALVAVLGLLTMFRPLHTDYFIGNVMGGIGYTPRLTTIRRECGSVMFPQRVCLDVFGPNRAFGYAIAVVGVAIAVAGAILFRRRDKEEASLDQGSGGRDSGGRDRT